MIADKYHISIWFSVQGPQLDQEKHLPLQKAAYTISPLPHAMKKNQIIHHYLSSSVDE